MTNVIFTRDIKRAILQIANSLEKIHQDLDSISEELKKQNNIDSNNKREDESDV